MSGGTQNREFREAYSDYYPLVVSVLYSKVGRRDDAEDICQEVFIRFLKNFDSIDNHRAWLLSAIRFEITNYYNRKATAASDAVDIDEAFDDPNLKYVNGFRDTRIIIQEALDNDANFHNERERVLFELIAVYNFTYPSAAAQLGITRWQAEYLYEKIEKRILKYLHQKGIKDIGDLL